MGDDDALVASTQEPTDLAGATGIEVIGDGDGDRKTEQYLEDRGRPVARPAHARLQALKGVSRTSS